MAAAHLAVTVAAARVGAREAAVRAASVKAAPLATAAVKAVPLATAAALTVSAENFLIRISQIISVYHNKYISTLDINFNEGIVM